MADQLYLSLWFPNFRLATLPAALTGVLEQFARIASDDKPASPLTRIAAASVYPIDWTESATWQRIYVNDPRSEEINDSVIQASVAEATEQLHDDSAYEFEMRWQLWMPAGFSGPASPRLVAADDGTGDDLGDDDRLATISSDNSSEAPGWTLQPSRVRITGFGPDFDSGAYDQNGHIRVDFGLDTPWVLEDEDLDKSAAVKIKQNVEKLLAFVLLVEKNCSISSRLLWTESGEPLAEKLIARLQRLN